MYDYEGREGGSIMQIGARAGRSERGLMEDTCTRRHQGRKNLPLAGYMPLFAAISSTMAKGGEKTGGERLGEWEKKSLKVESEAPSEGH
jgi:hypothetical protein